MAAVDYLKAIAEQSVSVFSPLTPASATLPLAGSAAPSPPGPFAPEKLATVTRHVGIAEFGGRSITGFPAWLIWGLLHLRTLSDGHSKLSILANWMRLLITYRRSARLIVEQTEPTALAHPVAHSNSRGLTLRNA